MIHSTETLRTVLRETLASQFEAMNRDKAMQMMHRFQTRSTLHISGVHLACIFDGIASMDNLRRAAARRRYQKLFDQLPMLVADSDEASEQAVDKALLDWIDA